MKKTTIFYILSFFTIFLSVSNLIPELSFRTTDSDAYSLFTKKEEKTDISVKKTDLVSVKQVEKPATKANTAKTTISSKATSKSTTTSGRHFDYTRHNYVNRGVGNVVLSEAGNSIALYRFCSSCTPFLYAHNRAGLFQNLAYMKRDDTFSVKINGVIKTYRVQNNFTLKLSILNPDENASDDIKQSAAVLRKSLYTSTYGGKYDITLQTCAGYKDTYRRYIQAFEIK